jgi:hypothetical protein
MLVPRVLLLLLFQSNEQKTKNLRFYETQLLLFDKQAKELSNFNGISVTKVEPVDLTQRRCLVALRDT